MSASTLDADSKQVIKHYTETAVSQDSSFAVMTYNLGYLSGMTNNRSIRREKKSFDDNLQQAINLLSSFRLDIVGLQEIDFGASRSFEINQMDTLAIQGEFAMGYKSINWDKNYVPFPYWPPSNHFGKMLSGQAILSKLPIADTQTIVLPTNEKAPYHYRAFYLDRLIQISEIRVSGAEVIVLNVHLEAYDQETRIQQANIVKDLFEEYGANQPIILMGDFNSQIPTLTEEVDAVEIIMKSKDIASAIPFGKEADNRTFPSDDPQRMIDYIFYNQTFLTCDSARVVSEAGQISDHLPVWGSFQLR